MAIVVETCLLVLQNIDDSLSFFDHQVTRVNINERQTSEKTMDSEMLMTLSVVWLRKVMDVSSIPIETDGGCFQAVDTWHSSNLHSMPCVGLTLLMGNFSNRATFTLYPGVGWYGSYNILASVFRQVNRDLVSHWYLMGRVFAFQCVTAGSILSEVGGFSLSGRRKDLMCAVPSVGWKVCLHVKKPFLLKETMRNCRISTCQRTPSGVGEWALGTSDWCFTTVSSR